jgi:cytochrome c55X
MLSQDLFPIEMIYKQVLLAVVIVILLAPLPTIAELEYENQNRIIHMIRHDCGSCHGMTLNGGLGPALTVEALAGKSDDALFNIIMHGVEDTPMPPWNSILSKQEVSWIVKQLKQGLPDDY